jgi:hypothetical protein
MTQHRARPSNAAPLSLPVPRPTSAARRRGNLSPAAFTSSAACARRADAAQLQTDLGTSSTPLHCDVTDAEWRPPHARSASTSVARHLRASSVRRRGRSAPGVRYACALSRNWIKKKCPDWRRINAERWRILEGASKPVLTEAQKDARKEAPGTRPCAGAASGSRFSAAAWRRERRRHLAILEREIAELEQAQFSIRLDLVKWGKRG